MIKHIGLIMDGNRRFARELMKRPWKGHKIGVKKAREVLEWACERGIKCLTAYTLSLENLKSRPKKELDMILKYLVKEANDILNKADHVINRFDVKVKFIGRMNELPQKVGKKLKAVEKKTNNNNKHFLNIAVAYGGQQEIVDAIRKILVKGMNKVIKPSDMNIDVVKEHLYTNGQPCPDMIIRTGGEKRLSNFMPFQSAYSELIFLDKKFPEMTKEDFEGALEEFERRQRRFGH